MPRRKNPTAFTAAIGERLFALRSEADLPLVVVGMDDDDGGNLKGHISNIEHGRVNPTLIMLRKMADNMSTELPYLVTLPGESPRQRLIERTRYLSDAEVEHWLVELGPAPALPGRARRPIVKARKRAQKERKSA